MTETKCLYNCNSCDFPR